MQNEYSDEPKQSKYNAAVAQLYRIDNLWQAAHLHSRTGQLLTWNWDLDAVWRELAGDASEKQEKDFYEINKKMIKYMRNKNLFYQMLERKEVFLRRMQNKQGKGTAYVDPNEDDLEEL